ncbi:MAG: EamA family transporter, partial [bacterium]|nr:EamA family transporter [bacterium]
MPEQWPIHLVLPLTASFVFVFGLMLIKKANDQGVNQWTVTFCANMLAFVLFANYLWLGDPTPAASTGEASDPDGWLLLSRVWQPATIALLFILGQVFTFSAISVGDVSLATPVFSVKVIFVAILVTLVSGEQLTAVVWCCAALATVGVAMVQFSGRVSGKRAGLTTLLALAAASSFATHDLLVQQWAPQWPMSLFLPIVFGIAAILSLGFIPFMA